MYLTHTRTGTWSYTHRNVMYVTYVCTYIPVHHLRSIKYWHIMYMYTHPRPHTHTHNTGNLRAGEAAFSSARHTHTHNTHTHTKHNTGNLRASEAAFSSEPEDRKHAKRPAANKGQRIQIAVSYVSTFLACEKTSSKQRSKNPHSS